MLRWYTEQQFPKMPVNNFVVDLNPHEDREREVSKTTDQNESLDSDDVEAYIRDEFNDVIGTDLRSISQTTICEHAIEVTTNKAIKQTARIIPFALRDEVKRQIDEMLSAGLIRESPWASPIILVKKSNGKIRVCIDYRKLNEVTVKATLFLKSTQ